MTIETKHHRTPLRGAIHRCAPFLVALAVAACGGDEADVAETPPDTTPASPPQVGLATAELGGLELADMILSLPWMTGSVNRDPDAGAKQARLAEVTIGGLEGFDRTLFTFAEGDPVPGYRMVYGDSALAVCGQGSSTPLPAGTSETLVVRLRAAGASAVRQRQHEVALPNLRQARLVCEQGDTVVWALSVASPTQIRIHELRNPSRLAVDVSHPGVATATLGSGLTAPAGTP